MLSKALNVGNNGFASTVIIFILFLDYFTSSWWVK